MPAGRPPEWNDWITPDGLLRIEGWARDGLSLAQIAKNMGIANSALSRWRQRCPQIQEAIKKGKAPVDLEVENQVLKSALGFKVTVKKPIKLKTMKQDGTKRIVTEYIEYVDEEIYIPPVPVNQFFWLKNRLPDKWKDHPTSTSNASLEKLDEVLAKIGGVE